MRRRIQRSMILMISIMLLISYAVATVAVYVQTLRVVEDEIRQEADYICAAIEISGESYLREMDYVSRSTRVTLISPSGKVLYDARNDAISFDSHSDRPEVRAALADGAGDAFRWSESYHTQMFYQALRLSDGNILRVSKSVDSAYDMALKILPVMIVMALVMLAFAWRLSGWQAKRLVHPINTLDLERPLDNEVYEELSPLLERIDRQNRAKDAVALMRKEFSANVSHELRTPLTSVFGYAELLKDGLVRQEDIPKFAGHIYHEAQRLIRLVEDIMRLSRLDEHQEIQDRRERVDLYEIALEVADHLRQPAEQARIGLHVEGQRVYVNGIRHILEELLFNICENAIKYNHENGSVLVRTFMENDCPVIAVSDTGIGIPAEEQERIFERFYRVDKSHSKATGGTGLGLSIAKHGAMIHDAVIHVDSVPGKGTTMRIEFPGSEPGAGAESEGRG